MTTKVFIHIGMHKTGTTFLQEEIFSKIPNINYQNKVDLTTEVQEEKINLFSDENLDGGSYRLFSSVKTRNIILKNVHKLFPEAKIILCIRNQDKWLKSAYKQYIVAYRSYSYKDYKKRLDPELYNVDSLISFINRNFDDFYVCYFEDLQKNPQKFVKGICDFIGVDVPKFENKIIYKGITNGQVRFIRFFDFIFRPKICHFVLSIFIRMIRKDKTIIQWLGRKE